MGKITTVACSPKMPFELLVAANESDIRVTLFPETHDTWSRISVSDSIITEDKIFTEEEIKELKKDFIVMFDIINKQVDYFIFTERPLSIQMKKSDGLFNRVEIILKKNSECHYGKLQLSNLEDGFINKYLEPMIGNKFYGGWN